MRYFATAVLCLVVACATPYQGMGFRGGYSETQLGPNVFRVAFKANAFSSHERAANLALLRSAELTLEHGFRYFVLVDSEAYSKASMHSSNNHAYTLSKPRRTNTIVCFREKPDLQGSIFDAEFLVKSLRSKYEIRRRSGSLKREPALDAHLSFPGPSTA